MKQINILFLVACMGCCFGCQSKHAEEADIDRTSWRVEWVKLDSTIRSSVTNSQIPGAVLLILQNGEPQVFEAYGSADPLDNRPMQKDDLFRICSQTKAITSTAAMILWQDGMLGLDDPVTKYLPEFESINVLDSIRPDLSIFSHPAEQTLTIRHLLTHTSGIPYGEIGDPRFEQLYDAFDVVDLFPRDERSNRENARRLAVTGLAHEPGTRWTYGLGLDVLVAVVEVASGTPFAEFVEERIFQPLEMHDTFFAVPSEKQNRLVNVVERVEEAGTWKVHEHPRYAIDYPLHEEWPLTSGGAGLVSTAEDYGRFLQMYIDRGIGPHGRLLSESTVDSIMADHASGLVDGNWHQGLAFGVRDGNTESGAFFWSGYFNTAYFADPSTGIVAVLMKQTYGLKTDATAQAFNAMIW